MSGLVVWASEKAFNRRGRGEGPRRTQRFNRLRRIAMSEDVNFPVYVLAKDCGEVTAYPSVEVMNAHFEAVDVENNEYDAWDVHGYQLTLRVSNARPIWLSMKRLGSSRMDEAKFAEVKAAAKQYREPEGLIRSLKRGLFRR